MQVSLVTLPTRSENARIFQRTDEIWKESEKERKKNALNKNPKIKQEGYRRNAQQKSRLAFFFLVFFLSQSVRIATRAVPAERGGPRIPIPHGPPPSIRNKRGKIEEKRKKKTNTKSRTHQR